MCLGAKGSLASLGLLSMFMNATIRTPAIANEPYDNGDDQDTLLPLSRPKSRPNTEKTRVKAPRKSIRRSFEMIETLDVSRGVILTKIRTDAKARSEMGTWMRNAL